MINKKHNKDQKNKAPAGYYVYYNPRVHQFKLLAILAICIVLVIFKLYITP